MKKKIIFLSLILTVGMVFAGSAQTVYEDYERSNPLNIYNKGFGGDTSTSVENSIVFNGSNSIKLTANNSDLVSYTETDDLTHPSAGDKFNVSIYLQNNNDGKYRVQYAAQSETKNPDGYFARINTDTNEFVAVDRENGNGNSAASTSVSWGSYTDQWLTVQIDWGSSGNHVHTIYDSQGNEIAQNSFTDSNYGSGGIGFLIFSQNDDYIEGYWDYWVDSDKKSSSSSSDETSLELVRDDFEGSSFESNFNWTLGEGANSSAVSVTSSESFSKSQSLNIKVDGDSSPAESTALESTNISQSNLNGTEVSTWVKASTISTNNYAFRLMKSNSRSDWETILRLNAGQSCIRAFYDGGAQCVANELVADKWYQLNMTAYEPSDKINFEVSDRNGLIGSSGNVTTDFIGVDRLWLFPRDNGASADSYWDLTTYGFQDVSISESNVVDFSSNVTVIEPSEQVEFTNETSGSSFDWSFGDGNTASGQSVTHSYSSQGTYTVELNISFSDGSNGVKTRDYIVSKDFQGNDSSRFNDILGSSSYGVDGKYLTSKGSLDTFDSKQNYLGGSTGFNGVSLVSGFDKWQGLETLYQDAQPSIIQPYKGNDNFSLVVSDGVGTEVYSSYSLDEYTQVLNDDSSDHPRFNGLTRHDNGFCGVSVGEPQQSSIKVWNVSDIRDKSSYTDKGFSSLSSDGEIIYDDDTGLFHVYYEDGQNSPGVYHAWNDRCDSSGWVTDSDNPVLNFDYQTGDLGIVEFNDDRLITFLDNTTEKPYYTQSIGEATDYNLSDLQVVGKAVGNYSSNIVGVQDGTYTWNSRKNRFEGFFEVRKDNGNWYTGQGHTYFNETTVNLDYDSNGDGVLDSSVSESLEPRFNSTFNSKQLEGGYYSNFSQINNVYSYSFDWQSNYSVSEFYVDQFDQTLSFPQTESISSDTDSTPPTSSDNWSASGFVDQSSATVELTASDSGGNGVADIYYRVNGGSYNVVQGSSATVTINTQGNNTLEYYAEDSAGNVEATNTEHVALESNSAPTASFTTTTTDLELGVDASGSSDSDGSVSQYDWDWTNDGNYEATGETTSHTYGSEGTYNVKLRVTDNDGAVDTQVETISVSSSTNDGGDGGGGGGGTTDTTPPDTTDNWDVSGFLDKTQAAVSLSATDAGVGVDRIEYQINGNGFTSVSGNSASVDIFTEGNNTLEYYAVDNNGNEEQTQTEYVAFKTSTDDGGSGGDGGDGSQGTVSLQLESPQGDIDKDGATEINQVFDTTVDVNNSGTIELQISSESQTGFTAVDGKAIGINSDQSQQFTETFKIDYSNISDSKQVSEEISYRLEWQGDDGYSLASSVQKFRYINSIGGSGNNATGLFGGVPSGLGVYLLLVLLLGVLALPLLIKVRLND